MDRNLAKKFALKHADSRLYQPIILIPNIVEIRGKWHQATKDLCDIILSDVAGKSILDLGCNLGYFLQEAMAKGARRAVGVEHDSIVIRQALEIEEICQRGVKIIHEDIDKFTPDDSFDIILMLNIMHVLPNPRQTIDRYMEFTLQQIIIEHEFYQLEHFGDIQNYNTFKSPRCASQRYVTILNV